MIKVSGKFCLFAVLLTVFCLSLPLRAAAQGDSYYMKHPKEFTVEEAYEFFDRERTPYDKTQSPIPENEAAYLDHFFYVSDMAMQARVNMMQYYFAGTSAHKKQLPNYLKVIEEIGESFRISRAPTADLKQVEDLFLAALGEQRDFFIQWSNARGPAFTSLRKNFQNHELVQSSHFKLQRAYTQLMLIYPNETAHNQKAFYDHLCALDFI